MTHNTDGYPIPPTREQLEELLERGKTLFSAVARAINFLLERDALLVEALKFYAEQHKWLPGSPPNLAREALKKVGIE